MSRIEYINKPLSDMSWLRPDFDRTTSMFRATWADTQDILALEVTAIGVRDQVVIGLDVRESDLKINGQIRSGAKPSTPGVEVAFVAIQALHARRGGGVCCHRWPDAVSC